MQQNKKAKPMLYFKLLELANMQMCKDKISSELRLIGLALHYQNSLKIALPYFPVLYVFLLTFLWQLITYYGFSSSYHMLLSQVT